MLKSKPQTTFIWFTGLSGSGKSTIASGLKLKLEANHQTVTIVDGDAVREKFHQNLGFSVADIKKNNQLIIDYCLDLRGKYRYVLITVIAPFASSRKLARRKLQPDYYEIYVSASLCTVTQRDVKGLYEKAKRGEINNMIGVDPLTPYEVPLNPDLIIDTEQLNLEQSVNLCMSKLNLDPA